MPCCATESGARPSIRLHVRAPSAFRSDTATYEGNSSAPARVFTMRLLVTGGAGFIGANFVHTCVRKHAQDSVTVLDALTYAGSRESLAPVEDDIRLVQGDITDAELVSKLVA